MTVREIIKAGRARGNTDRGEIVAPEVDRAGNIPDVVRLPSPGQISADMTTAQLVDLLDRYDAVDLEALLGRATIDAIGLIDASRERILAALDGLTGQRTLMQLARPATTRYDTLLAISDPQTGEVNFAQELVRISEGDEHVCPVCQDLAGLEGPISVHEDAGLPGSASCLGGDSCRCQLVAVD